MNNFTEAFDIQARLDNVITVEKGINDQLYMQERFLALLVEVGELANEWRGFKFWSNDQEPRTVRKCEMCDGFGNDIFYTGSLHTGDLQENSDPCEYCDGMGNDESENSLLEEYVDNMHFLLSIGNYSGFTTMGETLDIINIDFDSNDNITELFIEFFHSIVHFRDYPKATNYVDMWEHFFAIGSKLGFTKEDMFDGYMKKNEINYHRQAVGY